jgi:hypothetical protein
VVAKTEFIGPRHGGELAPKSKTRRSASTVSLSRIHNGSSMTPSLSMASSNV